MHKLAATITQSDWTHWLDSIDWIAQRHQVGSSDRATHLRLVAHLPDDELDIAQRYVESIAQRHGCTMNYSSSAEFPVERLADLTFKVTPDKAALLADEIAQSFAVHCTASCCVGAVWVRFDPELTENSLEDKSLTDRVGTIVEKYRHQVETAGGDCSSRWLDARPLSAIENQWVSRFATEAGIL